jgi:AraC-like DNA-binding protein
MRGVKSLKSTPPERASNSEVFTTTHENNWILNHEDRRWGRSLLVPEPPLTQGLILMSYDRRLLFEGIKSRISRTPRTSLLSLARDLKISVRTIESVVRALSGQTFREFQKQAVFERISILCQNNPAIAIKEISYDLGYCSSRSFARRIKMISGLTPQELRALLARRIASDNYKTLRLSSRPKSLPRNNMLANRAKL